TRIAVAARRRRDHDERAFDDSVAAGELRNAGAIADDRRLLTTRTVAARRAREIELRNLDLRSHYLLQVAREDPHDNIGHCRQPSDDFARLSRTSISGDAGRMTARLVEGQRKRAGRDGCEQERPIGLRDLIAVLDTFRNAHA